MIIDKIRALRSAAESDIDETIESLCQLVIEEGDEEMKYEVALFLLELCDSYDNEDAFGTEGWRHRLGVER